MITFKNLFDMKDTNGTTHQGFFQSLTFSSDFNDLTVLDAVVNSIMDAHLYNRFSGRGILKQWTDYLTYDKTTDKFICNPSIYTDIPPTLLSALMESEGQFLLLSQDWDSVKATYQESTIFGEKINTKNYDNVVVTLDKGTETENIGSREDTHVVGVAHSEASTTDTGRIYPLGASAYVDDNQTTSIAETDTDQQTNTDTSGTQENSKTYGQTTTETAEREDSSTDAAHTDTFNRIKVIALSPDKYLEIQMRLSKINAYNLIDNAIQKAVLSGTWGGGIYDRHII